MEHHPYAAPHHQPPPWPPGHHHPAAPPPWPPPYMWQPNPPPSRRRSWIALVLLVVFVAALGSGVAIAVNTLTRNGGGFGATTQSVVDVNSDLGNGSAAAGTGMLLSSNGQVLTNNHVVDGALKVTVQVAGEARTYTARVLGVDPTDDIAVLQLTGASGLGTVKIGDSSKVTVGDRVTVVGNALGKGGPPASSSGSVTALDQTITAIDANGSNPETLNGMIQFNAAIQPGDSGGPLLDASGTVVGMDTAGSSNGRRAEASNVGFAIPINSAMTIARQIISGNGGTNIQNGSGPLLGVDVQNSTTPPGALVVSVVQGTPADSAGITAQDIITSVNTTPVSSAAGLKTALNQHHPGDTVTVGFIDGSGQQQHVSLQLATAPPR